MFEFAFDATVEHDTLPIVLNLIFNSKYGLITIFFWLDLIYNFFTAFYDKEGELQYNHREIAKHYIQSYFIIDLVSNLPLTGPFGLLKAARMIRMSRVLTRWSYLGYDPNKLQIFKLVILIITIGHFLACAFFMVSKLDYLKTVEEEGYEFKVIMKENTTNTTVLEDKWGNEMILDNWISADADIDLSILAPSEDDGDMVRPASKGSLSAYLTSMYFAYSTLTTVGYGDISAHTDIERGMAVISLIAGSVIYAVLVGIVNNLVDSSDVKETEYQQRLAAINSFMKSHHLPIELRNRVRRYMELDHKAAHHDVKLLEYLSPMLQREAIMHMNRHFVTEVPFLADADSIFVWCLLERMICIVCVQKEYILVEGQAVEAMHIIKTGKVNVINANGKIIRTYTVGSFFGEACYDTSTKMYARESYRAKVDMELCLISRDDMHMLVEAFPEFKETIEIIRNARDLHEKREAASYEDKMKKMMKQTGIKARPVTPPHGKSWSDEKKFSEICKNGERALSCSPSKNILLQGLGADVKNFEETSKKLATMSESSKTR